MDQAEAVESDREITILLLGETGVGKSTWINGFANFLRFTTLDVAEKESTLCLIPTTFTVTDENYEEKLISVGSDGNEVMETGKSATQHPQSYLFEKDDYTVRLIDTPGIGDVRGVEQDKKNFELILDHISHLDSLHAICILLKPNNARLNIMFQFCIKELLTHLHKDACSNIVFCFTNSRSTFYRPGDTLPALRKLIEENENVEIPLNQSTLYCMDNEAIRFLYAMKNGIQFTEDERKNYNTSWEKSVEEIARLLNKAGGSLPHAIQSTLSLNTARQTILALGSPMAEVTRSIQLNIAMQKKYMEQVKVSEYSMEELSRNLVTKEYEIKMKPLPEPRTVCTAVGCVELIEVGGVQETNYKTHCHGNCGTGKEKHFKIANIVGHKKLQKCSAFNSNGNCKLCNCSWKHHMKITYETTVVVKDIPDISKQIEIQNQENSLKKIEKYIEIIGKYINELKEEQAEITRASIQFAKFLRLNAITPYNNAMDAYITHFIHDEKNKLTNNGGNASVLEGLLEMQKDYRRQMEVLEQAMQQDDCGPPLTPTQLEECVQKLYQMKHNGVKLRDMMHKSQDTAASCFTEKRIDRNASFTIVNKTKKRHKFLNEVKGLFKPQKSVKHRYGGGSNNNDERGGMGIGGFGNRSASGKRLQPNIPTNKPKIENLMNDRRSSPQHSNNVSTPSQKYVPDKKPATTFKPVQRPQIPQIIRQPSEDVNTKQVQQARPPPPPPPPITENASQILVPELTSARANLLDDIRKQPKLKKTGTNPGNSLSSAGKASTDDSLQGVLKRALEIRATKVQDSVDDDEWD